MGWGLAVLEVPVTKLWAGLNDELRHVGITDVDHVEILSGSPCLDQRVVMMHLPLPLLSDRWWVVQNQFNPRLTEISAGRAYELSWSEVSDVSLDQLTQEARALAEDAEKVQFSRGGWLIAAISETHSLALFHSWNDPGGKLPSAFSYLATMGIQKTFQVMASYAAQPSLPCSQQLKL